MKALLIGLWILWSAYAPAMTEDSFRPVRTLCTACGEEFVTAASGDTEGRDTSGACPYCLEPGAEAPRPDAADRPAETAPEPSDVRILAESLRAAGDDGGCGRMPDGWNEVRLLCALVRLMESGSAPAAEFFHEWCRGLSDARFRALDTHVRLCLYALAERPALLADPRGVLRPAAGRAGVPFLCVRYFAGDAQARDRLLDAVTRCGWSRTQGLALECLGARRDSGAVSLVAKRLAVSRDPAFVEEACLYLAHVGGLEEAEALRAFILRLADTPPGPDPHDDVWLRYVAEGALLRLNERRLAADLRGLVSQMPARK